MNRKGGLGLLLQVTGCLGVAAFALGTFFSSKFELPRLTAVLIAAVLMLCAFGCVVLILRVWRSRDAASRFTTDSETACLTMEAARTRAMQRLSNTREFTTTLREHVEVPSQTTINLPESVVYLFDRFGSIKILHGDTQMGLHLLEDSPAHSGFLRFGTTVCGAELLVRHREDKVYEMDSEENAASCVTYPSVFHFILAEAAVVYDQEE